MFWKNNRTNTDNELEILNNCIICIRLIQKETKRKKKLLNIQIDLLNNI